jgi:hypothetical protein
MGILRRDPPALARKEHDVLVIGGGNSGVCAAWDAAAPARPLDAPRPSIAREETRQPWT